MAVETTTPKAPAAKPKKGAAPKGGELGPMFEAFDRALNGAPQQSWPRWAEMVGMGSGTAV